MRARRLTQLAVLGALAAATLAGCGGGGRERAAASYTRAGGSLIAPLPGPQLGTSIPALVSRLSLRQLGGERVIYSYEGASPPPALLDAIEAGEAGGVILSSSNVLSTSELQAVASELQHAAMESAVRLPLPIVIPDGAGPAPSAPGAAILSEAELVYLLRVQGMTVTAPLDVGGPHHHGLPPAYGAVGIRAVLAAAAGTEIFICAGGEPEEGEAAAGALSEAMRAEQLEMGPSVATVERIVSLRQSLAEAP